MKAITRFLTLSSIGIVCFASTSRAAGDADDFYEMRNGGAKFLAILESLPYASEGSGPVMFTFEYSECPYCQGLYRDYKAGDTGLEFRRVFVPVSARSAAEAAALGKSRDIEDFHAFMTGRKRAPAVFNRDPASVNAYNAILKGTDEIEAILKQNGWPRRGLVFPQFVWVESGRVFTSAGYEKSDFGKAVARALKGGGTAEVWARLGGSSDAPQDAGTGLAGTGLAGTNKAPPQSSVPAMPLDNLTALFIYHKLAGEPLDFDRIAGATLKVQRTAAFDKGKATDEMAAMLRENFEAADPAATYTITLRAQMKYDPNQERYEVDTFGPDRYLPMVPFRPQGGVMEPWAISDNRLSALYDRRLMFLNASNARYVPLPSAQARGISPTGWATALAEVSFTFVDAQDSVVDAEKTLRAQVTQIRYAPTSGTMSANWPFQEPIAVAAADVPGSDESSNRIDDLTVFNLYHKLSGEPIDFETIGPMLAKVARAGQFDKPGVMAEEISKLKSAYEAADPEITYSLRVRTNLKYDLEKERFTVEMFEPGRHLLYQPMNKLVDSRHGMQARLFDRKLVFANGESARYIPLPKAEAAGFANVAQYGAMGAAADIEFRFVGTGDPTGAVEGRNIALAEITSLRFVELDRQVSVKPYDPKALPVKPVKSFDIVGLKTGVPLKALQRTIEKEFGPIGAIRPGKNEDPRLVSGIGHNPDGCFSFGNNVAEVGNVCIRAFADDGGTVRKIIVEQILEGAEWDPIREALLTKYGAMAESVSKSNNRYYGWGSEVAPSVTMDDQIAPQRTLTASLSAIQSAMDRMAASTRVSTNLRIRLVDADWAGAPAPETPEETPRPSGPRL